MLVDDVVKTILVSIYIVKLCNFSSHFCACDGISLSTDDGDELLASLQNLDVNTQKIAAFINDYKGTESKHDFALHPSLWSPEYYHILNPKTFKEGNKSTIQIPKETSTISSRPNKSALVPPNIPLRHIGETRKSSYTIKRENEAENEIVGFGASSRTVIQPIDENRSKDNTNDNALKWISTSGKAGLFHFLSINSIEPLS